MVCAVDDVARRIVDNLGAVDAMKLEKLIYYSQAWHLAVTGEALFPNAIEAWSWGPVVPAVYAQHRGQFLVKSWPTGDVGRLGEQASRLIDIVCEEYGALSGPELSRLTHSEEPWKATRGDLPDGAPGNTAIARDLMTRYYRGRALGGFYAADLAVGMLPESADSGVQMGRSGDPLQAGPEPLGFGQREVAPAETLREFDYPEGPSRVRPALRS